MNAAPSAQILKQSSAVIESEIYRPENYADLAPELRHGLTAQDYQGCVDRLSVSKSQFYKITYLSRGLKIVGLVSLPATLRRGQKYSTVIFNHGGAGEFGRLFACSLVMAQSLFANDGQRLIFASQYRGIGGSEGQDEVGGKDVQDVLKLLRIARQMNFVDTKNIFMAGHSRGGSMTALALGAGAKVNAAISLAGAFDLIGLVQTRPEMEKVYATFIPHYSQNPNHELKKRSAIYWPEKIKAPLLLLHGDADSRVPFKDSQTLHRELERIGKTAKLVVYPGEEHGLAGARPKVRAEIKEWIQAHSK